MGARALSARNVEYSQRTVQKRLAPIGMASVLRGCWCRTMQQISRAIDLWALEKRVTVDADAYNDDEHVLTLDC